MLHVTNPDALATRKAQTAECFSWDENAPANSSGCEASATPAALASSAVMVTPLGFSRFASASSLSVVIVYATRNSGTWWCSKKTQCHHDDITLTLR